jgi:hypothetical protein
MDHRGKRKREKERMRSHFTAAKVAERDWSTKEAVKQKKNSGM